MSKILVFNVPAHGHVNPTLPVVPELVACGEQVVYYLTEEFEPQIQRTGATFRRIEGIQNRFDPPPSVYFGGQANPASTRQTMIAFFPRMLAGGLRLVPQLIEQARAEDADYVIYDFICSWGRALAELLDLPAVAFVPTYAMNEHSSLVRRMSYAFDGQPSTEVAQAMSEFQDASRQLHKRYGLAPLTLKGLLIHTEAQKIVTMPRRFQSDAGTFGERYVFVGPCVAPRGDASGFPLDGSADSPTLYISLGTVFTANPEFFTACFDAFANSKWRVVLSIGTRVDLSTIGRVPDNFLVRSHVPQLEVLEHADVFVTHGGMNSTMEAIYYGVPMVVVPQQPEQAMTAARVAELGLGIALEPDRVTTDALRDAVATIDGDANYRNRVARMQKAAHDAGGYLRAADVIQRFGRQHSKTK